RELDFFDKADRPESEELETARRAAVDVAIALGRCRLHGVDLAEDDGVLPLKLAQAAVPRLIAALDRRATIACDLENRLNQAAAPIEIEDLCLNLLRDRLDAWAAFLAIDEAYAATRETEGMSAAVLPSELLPLLQAIDRYDEALQAQLDVFTMVAD